MRSRSGRYATTKHEKDRDNRHDLHALLLPAFQVRIPGCSARSLHQAQESISPCLGWPLQEITLKPGCAGHVAISRATSWVSGVPLDGFSRTAVEAPVGMPGLAPLIL